MPVQRLGERARDSARLYSTLLTVRSQSAGSWRAIGGQSAGNRRACRRISSYKRSSARWFLSAIYRVVIRCRPAIAYRDVQRCSTQIFSRKGERDASRLDLQPPPTDSKNVVQPATIVGQVDPILPPLSSVKSTFSVRPHAASSILDTTPSLKPNSREPTTPAQNEHQSAL